jgi:hypothetical protein
MGLGMKLGPLALGRACALLGLHVVVSFCVVGSFAYSKAGMAGLATAAVAAGVCWLAATLALILTTFAKNSAQRVSGMLIANAVRFGVPLVTGATLRTVSEVLAARGVFGWIVVFYLLTLLAETPLSVLVVGTQDSASYKGIATNG